MIRAYLFRPRRRRNGKIVSSKHWYIRWKQSGDEKYQDICTGVRDEQVAQSTLTEFVREKEREASGVILPRSYRDAASRTMADHLADYVAEKSKVGRDKMYLYNIRKHVEILIEACGWKLPRDVTADSFEAWRSSQTVSGKTLNQYLADVSGLLNWMKRRGRITAHPLAVVERLEVLDDGSPIRAMNDEEVTRLLAIAPAARRVVYLVALTTGLRRSELEELRWDDVKLDAPKPFIRARPSTTKNGKTAVLWLPDYLVTALGSIQPASVQPAAPVFVNGVPDMETFRLDLEAAKIPEKDECGRKTVFHSLRHTLATNLQRSGVPARIAMEVMRHSDMRLTNRVYTDATMLPTHDAIEKLPRWDVPKVQIALATGTNDTQYDTQPLGHRCPAVSSPVTDTVTLKSKNRPENPSDSLHLSASVQPLPEPGGNRGSRIRI